MIRITMTLLAACALAGCLASQEDVDVEREEQAIEDAEADMSSPPVDCECKVGAVRAVAAGTSVLTQTCIAAPKNVCMPNGVNDGMWVTTAVDGIPVPATRT